MKRHAFLLSIAILAGGLLQADVTARYHTTMQFSPLIPGMDQAMKGFSSAMPGDTVIRMKGTKGYTRFGRMEAIADYATQRYTVLDPAAKSYATAPMSQAMDWVNGVIPDLPPNAAQALESLKATFTSSKTGRMETILGIQAEETEGTLAIEGPALPGATQSGPLISIVMHIWTARPDEVLRVAPLRELTGYTQFSANLFNTGEVMKKLMGKIPGFGQGMDSIFEQIQKNKSVALRTQMEMRMPMMAQLAQQMAKSGQTLPAGVDPNGPLMQMTQELVELSGAPVDDALFQVPEGFHEASLPDLLKTVITPPAPQPN